MAGHETRPTVTSVDVAQRAGVSQAAVSLVLGGKASGRVGKQTQEAILRAARELGYHPNSAARTLRSGRSRLVVLAVPDVSNPYFAAVLQGAEQTARRLNYAVMLASIRDEYDWQQVILDGLLSRAVDGFLLFTLYPPTESIYNALRGRGVLIDESAADFPSLRLDIEVGMHKAMAHLLELGHTRIAHLGAAVDAETFHLRSQTYQEALQAAGHAVIGAYQERASFTIDDAYQAAYRILKRPNPPSAIMCDSDVLAVGVYKAAKELRLTIPYDLSVVGFDDSPIARMLDPELTTVAIPTTVVGERALLLLLGLLEDGQAPSQVIIPLELVRRASTMRIGSMA